MTCHAHYWDDIASAFTDKYAVYALDWRGQGDSAAATSYGYSDYLDDLSRLLNQLNPADLILVGHSVGGKKSVVYQSCTAFAPFLLNLYGSKSQVRKSRVGCNNNLTFSTLYQEVYYGYTFRPLCPRERYQLDSLV